jgi:SAM-dependent methyltransferase
MAIQCPRCRRQYDVTLFEFGRRIECDCGEELDLNTGHQAGTGGEWAPSPITPPTWDYIRSPHIATDYDAYHRFNDLLRYDTEVLDRWFPQPCRLLDLGCGTGRHLVHFAARGFDATGLDLSEHMLAVARRTLAEHCVGATLVHGDITKLPTIGLGRFDAVLCMFSVLGMIYGRANRVRFLADVRDLLAPGGRFALHVHNRWFNLWYRDGREYLRGALASWLKRRPEPFQKSVDGYQGIRNMSLYVFSARELRRDLARAGLAIEQFLYLNRRRNGTLRGPFRGLRSNGFLVLVKGAE